MPTDVENPKEFLLDTLEQRRLLAKKLEDQENCLQESKRRLDARKNELLKLKLEILTLSK